MLMYGCGTAKAPPVPQYKGDVVPVTGVIKMDGEPLADASVTLLFQGTPPEGFTGSGGKTDSTGRFVIRSPGGKEGTPPGRYKVTISKYASRSGRPIQVSDNPEDGMDIVQLQLSGDLVEQIPARYSDPEKTELSLEVTSSGVNNLELNLKNK